MRITGSRRLVCDRNDDEMMGQGSLRCASLSRETAMICVFVIMVCVFSSSGMTTAMGAAAPPAAGKRKSIGTTHQDLVRAVTSTCSLVVTSDVKLERNLPDVNKTACPHLRIVGSCGGQKSCKIDGQGKASFLRKAHGVHLENLEITRTTCSGADNAPVVFQAATLVVKNCKLNHNVNPAGGGAINAWESTVTIDDSVLEFNKASIGGGAIFLDSFARLVATNVVFRHNTATRGGAVMNVESNVQCTRCSFLENGAEEGGAVAMSDEDGTEAMFKDSQFVGNKVTKKGGMGGAVFIGNIYETVAFCNSKFERNVIHGGATQHVYIDIMPDYGSVSFCPARPASGVAGRAGSESAIKDDCIGCT